MARSKANGESGLSGASKELSMCTSQVAVVKETQREHFDHISRLRHVSIVDNLVMAFEYLFGCWHRKLSRPFTLSGWTYEVCLNCGKKFAYNRADIGCGVAKATEVGDSRTSWHQNHATVSVVAGRHHNQYFESC
jgi:hypothetical protein